MASSYRADNENGQERASEPPINSLRNEDRSTPLLKDQRSRAGTFALRGNGVYVISIARILSSGSLMSSATDFESSRASVEVHRARAVVNNAIYPSRRRQLSRPRGRAREREREEVENPKVARARG